MPQRSTEFHRDEVLCVSLCYAFEVTQRATKTYSTVSFPDEEKLAPLVAGVLNRFALWGLKALVAYGGFYPLIESAGGEVFVCILA